MRAGEELLVRSLLSIWQMRAGLATMAGDDSKRRWLSRLLAMALVGDRSRWLATMAGDDGKQRWQATIDVAIAYDGVGRRSIALAGDDGVGGG